MAKSVTSLAVGAGAATAYLRPDLVAGAARDMAFGSFPSFSTVSGSNAAFAETEALKAMVEQLSRDLKSHQQRVMVVQTGNERGAGLTTYAVGIVGVGTVLYLTVVRGWRLGDFLYVTRRGLQQGLGQLHTRLEGLNARLNDVKARLQAKLNELGGKQDATIAAQREMSQRLDEVGRDVTNTGSQVRQIHGKVYDMDSALVEVGANQRHANHGIFILCKAVGELMQGSNIASRAELLEFTQHPIWQGDRLQGLESVLGDMDANSKGKRPFLLGGGRGSSPTTELSSARGSSSATEEDLSLPTFGAMNAQGISLLATRSLNGVLRTSNLGHVW
ncbi:hypothetical protein ACKKBG_A08175 [Auxenochlorella protothecoides x Auxenochlorella symbiontica]|uniref:DUF1664 domain-containing protein n=1 Tax=Auxenochlorella protothecoides TaxID=3075 RepID=A0A1D1ZN26_AUXPR